MNPCRLRRPNVAGGTTGMNFGPMQDFVAVNVSDPGDQMLVEQGRLDCSSGRPQNFSELSQSQSVNNGVTAKSRKLGKNVRDIGGVINHDFPKSSGIDKSKFVTVIKGHHDMAMQRAL
jgi:hypothetical protein